MLIQAFEGSVEPDYGQFYLKTGGGEYASDRVSGWGYEAHLEAPAPGFIYVGTLKKFSTTPVRVEVHDAEPDSPPAEWQHVAEVSFTGDGTLEVLSWSGDVAISVRTPDGPLRLRAMWAGLEPELAEGLPEDRPSNEHLELVIWPAPHADRKVPRWWPEWDLPPPSTTAPDGRRQIEGVDEVVRLLKSGLRPVPVDLGFRPDAPPLPGGTSGTCHGIWGDPHDATWWVDGYDVRRTMRTATADEVRDLVRRAKPRNVGEIRLPPDSRWTAMLGSIGVNEPPR
jgi:hypothetical protein